MITNEYIDFFNELSENNHREWFHENKKRYEKFVKKPFEDLVAELILIESEYQPISITPKEAVFRINRDIRFSNDKSPYKLNRSAVISPGGRKDHSTPGVYVELGAEKLSIAGGVWSPDKEQLQKVRSFIVDDIDDFKDVADEKNFVATFGGIRGDRNKRLTKEFADAAQNEPRVFNKQFYWWLELPMKDSIDQTDGHLADLIMEKVSHQRKQQEYFKEALGS